jgi:ABC-type glycerol-3-phosphate transport system substrate-binding protein
LRVDIQELHSRVSAIFQDFVRTPESLPKVNFMHCFFLKTMWLWLLLWLAACQTPPPEQAEIAVISFADFEYMRPLHEQRIARFSEQYPDVQVQFVPLDRAVTGVDVDYRLLASLADIVALPALPPDNEAGYFLNLDPFMALDPAFEIEEFWPGLIGGCRTGERQVGLPASVQPSLILFDETAFNAAGLPYPTPGWTWDAFQEVARALTRAGDDQLIRYGFVDSGQPLALLAPLVEAAPDGEALVQTLNWYVALSHEGVIPVLGGDEDGVATGESLVYGGRAAMWVGRLSDLPQLRAFLPGEIGVAPFPISANGGATHTNPATVSCVAISAGAAHPQAAWLWLKYLTIDPPQRGAGDVASRVAVAEQRHWWPELASQSEAALRFALEHAWYGDLSAGAMPAIGQALYQAMRGERDLTTALSAIEMVSPVAVPVATAVTPVAVATPVTIHTPSAGAAPSVVTVNYFTDFLLHTDVEAVNLLARAFNQSYPDIVVNVVEPGDLVGSEPFTIDAPSLAQRFDCYPQNTATARLFHDTVYSLNPLIDADAEAGVLLDDLPASLLDLSRVGGELYGLPVAIQPTVMYYNATHLASMGLPPPANEWTVEEFWQLATVASSEATYGFVPWQPGFEFAAIDFLLAGQNIRLYDTLMQPAVLNFDHPDVAGLVSQMVDLAHAGVIYPFDDGGTRTEWGDRQQRRSIIQAGNAAFWTEIAGLRYGFRLTGSPPPAFEVGVAPVPAGTSPLAPASADVALYISRQSAHPTACWQWIKFLSAQPGVFTGIPVRRSVIESADFEAAVGTETAAVYRAVLSQPRRNIVTDRLALYAAAPFQRWWEDALWDAFSGANPAAVLAKLQHKAAAYLECMASFGTNEVQEVWLTCATQVDPSFPLE